MTGAIFPAGLPAAGCIVSSKAVMPLMKMKNSAIWPLAGQKAPGPKRYADSSGGSGAPPRHLRHPQIESCKITLQLCTPSGLVTLPVRKRDGTLFKTARKANSGDAFPYKEETAED